MKRYNLLLALALHATSVSGSVAFAQSAPVLLKDIEPGTGSGTPESFTQVGGITYFTASTAAEGRELWGTDGTSSGTRLIRDTTAGTGGGSPRMMVACNGQLFFVANVVLDGWEPWKSDGSNAGTVPFANINPSAGSIGNSEVPAVLGSEVIFRANDGSSGEELWKSNLTGAGTVLIKDISPGGNSSFSARFTTMGSNVFFGASDGVNGYELWKTNGTGAGTVMVKDIQPGSSSGFDMGSSAKPVVVGGTLYFLGNNGTNGTELWKSDGTAAGTVMVKDIRPGSGSSILASAVWAVTAGTTLYFAADDGTSGLELWKTDGTSAGTVRVSDLWAGSASSNPDSLTAVDGTVFFSARTDYSGRRDLWKSNGIEAGTVRVNAITDPTNATGLFSVSRLMTSGGRLFFRGYSVPHGHELWTSDGTPEGTVMVSDMATGSDSSDPDQIFAAGDRIYYSAQSASTGRELYRYDLPKGEIAVERLSGANLVSGVGTVEFGDCAVGSSREVGFSLRNIGAGTLSGITASISGALGGDFSILPALPSALQGGGQTAFVLRFIPSTTGLRTSSLSILSNDADESPFTINLSGAGSTATEVFQKTIVAHSPLTGPDALPSAIPFNDGVENLLKYAFNMNLAGPDTRTLASGTGTAGLPVIGLTGSGPETMIRVEFLRRKGSGLIYTPKRSSTLAPGSFVPMSGTPVVTSINDNWERVLIQETANPATLPSSFAIVEVSLP